MSITPSAVITGTFYDDLGNPLAGVDLVFTLKTFGLQASQGPFFITGMGILGHYVVTATTNSSGVFTVTIWGNDVITVGTGSYYAVLASVGSATKFQGNYQFLQASSYNLLTAVPLVPFPTQSPITPPSGSQGANLFYAGPTSGSAQPPTFRSIVDADLPDVIRSIAYANTFSGSDIGVKINAAITYLGAAGGTVVVPAGTYTFSTQIVADNTDTLTIMGVGGLTGGAAAATELKYTGTANIVSAQSTYGFRLSNLQLVWNNASFNGYAVDLSHSAMATDTVYAEIDHCYFGAVSGGGLALSVINMDKVITSSVHHCALHSYDVGILGPPSSSSYSNANHIWANSFSSGTGDALYAHIHNPGQGWSIKDNTFEMGQGAGNAVALGYTGGVSSAGLEFSGNWIGDTGASAINAITLTGDGFQIVGNYIAGNSSSTAIVLSSANGVNISGNHFDTWDKALSLSGGTDVDLRCNGFASVTTIQSGTQGAGSSLTAGNYIATSPLAFISKSNLPADIGTMILAGGYTSPIIGKLYVGDGTGFQVNFSQRTGGTDTELFQFKDSGEFDASADINAGTYITAGTTIAAGTHFNCNGSAGVSAGPYTSISSITTVGGLVTALSGTSDERLKNSTPFTDGVATLLKINPVRYTLNEAGQKQTGLKGDLVQVGFLAQNIQSAIPEAITATECSKTDDKTEYLCFDDRPIIATLVNAIKELSAEIAALKALIPAPTVAK